MAPIMRLLSALASLCLVARVQAGIMGTYWPAYGTQSPSAVAWSYTDIGYYFVVVTTSTGISNPQPESTVKEFVAAAKKAGKKPLLSVGGWTGSRFFSRQANSVSNRNRLAWAMVNYMNKYGFAGIDLDWEYPNSEGIGCNSPTSADAANFLLILQNLRGKIGRGKLITSAVSVNGIIGADGRVVQNLAPYAKYLNYINLMTYDVGGPWAATTGPNCPLRKCGSDVGIEQAVQTWISRGFPANKILLGIPAYGYSYTTTSSTLSSRTFGSFSSKAYQSKSSTTPKGAPGDSNAASTDVCGTTTSQYNGQWTYKQLISNGLLSSTGGSGQNGYTRYFDTCSQTPFLFNPSKKHMINYDDASSGGAKAAWAKSKGLAGVFFFDSEGFDNRVLAAIKSKLG